MHNIKTVLFKKMNCRYNIYYLASLAAFCATKKSVTRRDNLLANRIIGRTENNIN